MFLKIELGPATLAATPVHTRFAAPGLYAADLERDEQ